MSEPNDRLRNSRSSFTNTATVTDFFYEELEREQTYSTFSVPSSLGLGTKTVMSSSYAARVPEIFINDLKLIVLRMSQ